jgi:predicted amidophosphoribosyltransferase
MDTGTAKGNQCPVCGEPTKEDEAIIYCENCGFNINKAEEDSEPLPDER